MNQKYYPIVDRYALPRNPYLSMGKKTGEYRQPRNGEWYLSGAIPECYLATDDLDYPYWIIKIVHVQRETIYTEVEE